jgi:hypothetical protein
MTNPEQEQRRSTQFDPEREEPGGKTVNKALSSKRVGDTGKLGKNRTQRRAAGKARSGSDSTASRRTRGN